ncbi:MAG: hypothetical protein QF596_02950 [Acidimicrobiales bacterium]|jgi:hypothetical protein|nr:hypothetical protein [Acidimicrobiales bacterium]MDP6299510.1 hypothetical protein [Acidimicrobiales bacterium]HJM28086.1 hypothetical protein [Acidimicrobiales bacterium]HJM97566.1 hypothetical protein [Acidimicrobiales bacterium]
MTGENLEESTHEEKKFEQEISSMATQSLEEFSISSLPLTETLTAEPSRSSQLLAFGSIIIGGLCGGLIGFAFTDLQCSDGCSGISGIGGLVGALVGAGGVGIVAILVLRAMNEWKTKKHPGENTTRKN